MNDREYYAYATFYSMVYLLFFNVMLCQIRKNIKAIEGKKTTTEEITFLESRAKTPYIHTRKHGLQSSEWFYVIVIPMLL